MILEELHDGHVMMHQIDARVDDSVGPCMDWLCSPQGVEEIGVDIYMGFMWFEANHYVLQESPMCTYVYLMKANKSLLTLTCLNQARFKNKSITSKIRYGLAKKGERLARALLKTA